jgi:hypothetical protein
LTHDFAPFGGAVGYEDYVANLCCFKSGTGDAGFFNQHLDVEEASELETAADATVLANFRGELLLIRNPCGIEGGLKLNDVALSQRRWGVASQQLPKRLELEQTRTGVGEGLGNRRHAF